MSLKFEFNGGLKFKGVATRSMSTPCVVVGTFQSLEKTSGAKSATDGSEEATHENVV